MATTNSDKHAKVMNPKMKGLFKGLRYISQIFEEEKEDEIQIGLPTDVKHVAHIGSDGPSNDAPSWMKGFNSGTLSSPSNEDDHDNNSNTKWVSEDSKRGTKAGADSPGKDSQGGGGAPRQSRRRNSSESNTTGDTSPKKRDPSSKSRSTRRSSKESTSSSGPDAPKKGRRKKSKEQVSGAGSGRSRSKTGGAADDDSVKQTQQDDHGNHDEEQS
ncbi:CRIB domain-containing protein RIC6-like [Andrographis paniculata]|uniref:CRIB domain-containing protein RIC6-like n=1 Tax=Andrographis paniculata TaxID=175694 RepID=UPI0021E8E62E|nr:CRIB domain-containing protein RIC6-like [Andrographis paniculata]